MTRYVESLENPMAKWVLDETKKGNMIILEIKVTILLGIMVNRSSDDSKVSLLFPFSFTSLTFYFVL